MQVLTEVRVRLAAPRWTLGICVRAGGAAFGFIITLVVARIFGDTALGVYALFLSLLAACNSVAAAGVEQWTVRQVAVAMAKSDGLSRHQVISSGFTTVAVAATLCAVVAIATATFFTLSTATRTALLFASAAAIPSAILRVSLGALRGQHRALLAQFFDGPLLGILTIVALLVSTYFTTNIILPSVAYCLAMVFVACLAVAVAKVRYVGPANAKAVFAPYRASSPIMLIVITSAGFDAGLMLFLANYSDAASAGSFRICLQFGGIFAMVLAAFNSAFAPRAATAYAIRDWDGLRHEWLRGAAGSAALCAPLAICMIAAPQQLLGLFGKEHIMASSAMMIIALAQWFGVATGSTGTILIMTGHERDSLRNAIGSLLVSVPALFFLVPHFGILGAALTQLIAIVVRNGLALLTVSRIFRRADGTPSDPRRYR